MGLLENRLDLTYELMPGPNVVQDQLIAFKAKANFYSAVNVLNPTPMNGVRSTKCTSRWRAT